MKQQIIIQDMNLLTKCIQTVLKNYPTLCIIIDGPCAAGKTTLATNLSNTFHAPIIAMDHFFLQPKQYNLSRIKEIGGNIDYERFEKDVLSNIHASIPITYQPYDCQQQTFAKEISIFHPSLLIIEGVYSQHPKFLYPHSLSIFLTIDPKRQYQRLMKRNPGLITRFIEEWIPKENEYFTHFQIQQHADIILEMNNFIEEEVNYAKKTI